MLFIVVDDRNNALGAYGVYCTAKTPHLDQLAEQGIRFDRAYAQDPVCNPSRSSFLNGLRPETTQVYGNFQTPRHKIGGVLMLPECFHKDPYFSSAWIPVGHPRGKIRNQTQSRDA